MSPTLFPGVAYTFLALMSHPRLLPKLLGGESREGETAFTRLLVSMLRFLAPSLRQGHLRDGTRALYLGTQRLLLVLLHDFPSYLSRAAYALLDAVPSNCIQCANIITSVSRAWPPATILLERPADVYTRRRASPWSSRTFRTRSRPACRSKR